MPWWIYAIFVVFISALIIFDLGVLNKRARVVTVKAALGWTAIWVTLALLFNIVIYWLYANGWAVHTAAAASGKSTSPVISSSIRCRWTTFSSSP